MLHVVCCVLATEDVSCQFGSSRYYALCGFGGILSCGITHTAVVPLDLVKCRLQVGTDPERAAAGRAPPLRPPPPRWKRPYSSHRHGFVFHQSRPVPPVGPFPAGAGAERQLLTNQGGLGVSLGASERRAADIGLGSARHFASHGAESTASGQRMSDQPGGLKRGPSRCVKRRQTSCRHLPPPQPDRAALLKVNPDKYKSIGNGFAVTVREDGVRGLAKGWAPTFIGYSMQGLCKFGFYEVFKILYSDLLGEVRGRGRGEGGPLGHCVCGCV